MDTEIEGTGLFKVPSLRNVAVSGPYMHDGRFKTLEEVLDHYSSKMKINSAMDWRLSNFANNGGMKITKDDKAALIAFLSTLTDYQMLQDPKFASPF